MVCGLTEQLLLKAHPCCDVLQEYTFQWTFAWSLELGEEIPQAIVLAGQTPSHVLQVAGSAHPCTSHGAFLSTCSYTESGSVVYPLGDYHTTSRSYLGFPGIHRSCQHTSAC